MGLQTNMGIVFGKGVPLYTITTGYEEVFSNQNIRG